MSAYTPSQLDQWKRKQQQAVPSPIYQNVNSAMGQSNYEELDDLPLPPPPSSNWADSTSWSTQQMGNLRFPPPPQVDYSYPSDINGNQFLQENFVESKSETNLYANVRPRPIVTGTDDSVCELINDLSLTTHSSDEQSFRSKDSTKPITLLASTYPSLNNQACVNTNSTSLSGTNKAKQQSDNSHKAIYANLNNSSHSHFGGPSYKPNSAPIKSYLRVNRSAANKEEEVDHLTDLLVKSMENSAEPDFFGMCNKCGEKVVGEGSGCTAMEMVYHIQCFTCFDCHKELRGKSFYAMDSNPFCEECYLNTLEKCCVCEKAILDRILRATGKPYHPSCFSCVVCKKCLDGIPFTVDASNQIHCIDDFHKKFAPRCSVCNDPIVPEPGKTETVRVVALDRSFHVACYKCEDCDLLLSSETEGRGCYPLDDHILCRSCNAKRVQEITAN